MTTRRRYAKQPGFATFTAITLITLVALAVMAMTLLTMLDARRQQHAQTEAQLRQMLLAGAAAAPTILIEFDPLGEHTITLPEALASRGASLTAKVDRLYADGRQVTLTAALPRGRAQQTLIFESMPGGWVLSDASLDRVR